MPTVDSCCCGCTLRTGTLVLLWLGVISSGLNILSGIATAAGDHNQTSNALGRILFNAIALGIYILGINGVEKERPSYLKPYLVLQIIGMVCLVIVMIALPIFGVAILSYISNASQNEGHKVDGTEQIAPVIIFLEVMCLFGLGLAYYFYIVVHSFYKELKNKRGAIA